MNKKYNMLQWIYLNLSTAHAIGGRWAVMTTLVNHT